MHTFKDLTGLTFGNLYVESVSEERVANLLTYNCKCICGKEVKIIGKQLTKTKARTNCGCINLENKRKVRTVDLSGQKFNRLTVINSAGVINQKHAWNCKCDCGNECVVRANSLLHKTKPTKSCGCLMLEVNKTLMTTHGLSKTEEYETWCGVKNRCYNVNNPKYNRWGGRGIKMSDSWFNSFEIFLEDMGNKPTVTSTIERINVNGNYEKDNCIWLEGDLQARNTTRNVLTETIVKQIKELQTKEYTCREIYNHLVDNNPLITTGAIWHVLIGNSWKDVE